MLSFLHAGVSSHPAAPPLSPSCWESPGSLSQIGIRGREPQAGTGKRARARSVVLQLKLSPSACDSSRAVGASCRNEWLHMGVYFYTFKGLGLSLPLKSVLVGGCLPALLEFQCEGASLWLPSWRERQRSWDQFFGKTELRDVWSPFSFHFARVPPFYLYNANIPTCTIVQEA